MNSTQTIILIVGGILLVLSIIPLLTQSKDKKGIQEKIKEIPDFEPYKTVLKTGLYSGIPTGISIDLDKSKALLIIGQRLIPLEAKDFIEAEVVVDGKTVTKTSRGSQLAGVAVGAILAGGVGAIIGGLSGKTTTQKDIKGVSLKILTTNKEWPIHLIDFIEYTSTGSSAPEIALREAKEWFDLIKVFIASK